MTTIESAREAPPGRVEAQRDQGERVLTPEILALAAVVVLGAIMTILDATIVNVALPTLGRDFHTQIATIQWVSTAYLLAFASVIPLTGWASQRFGAKPLWLASLGLFMAGSLLAGLSWSIGSLIAFRVVQGAGGGMIMPLGQTILAQAAGPKRMGRVMSIVGIPMLLAPIIGPVIGGVLVGAASWRWIFFVNLPVGALAVVLALRLLPSTPRRPGAPRDTLGLVLLSGGVAIFVYGLAQIGRQGTPVAALPLVLLAGGLLLVTLFVVHALRAKQPLLDVRLFARRGFGSAAATTFVLGTALFGVALLLPLYFQIVRGQSPLHTGLLLVPQGLGAAIAIGIAGALTDRLGARRVVPAGILLALAGTGAYTQISATTGYWYLAAALFLVGAGLGATITPSMAAAFHDLDHAQLPSATSAINVVQRVAASLGTALLAITLQQALTNEVPALHGGIDQAAALAQHAPRTTPAIAHAFATTFWIAFALTAAALIPALLLPSRKEDAMTATTPIPAGTRRPLRLRLLPRLFRIVNVPMRLLLALPFPTPLGKRLMLVYLTGRKTGRRYRQPVSYTHDHDTLLTPGGGRWKLNLIEGHPTPIRLRGRDITARPELIRDPDQIDQLLGLMTRTNPAVARFVPIPRQPNGHLDPDRLHAAIQHGFRIVRWHPDPPQTI